MPYVRRNVEGSIVSVHRESSLAASEYVDDRHPDMAEFLGRGPQKPEEFSKLDADFVRVIEDVIDTLIVKNVLNITDLPAGAQAKLFARKSFRERVSQSSLRLFEPTDFGDVI
ncbi:MAG TPA: hypothetical protein VGP22_09785 [Albitalea sp.]|jgi:hypothetical protein|nr:hypothetical protein [Albitalea sp.]